MFNGLPISFNIPTTSEDIGHKRKKEISLSSIIKTLRKGLLSLVEFSLVAGALSACTPSKSADQLSQKDVQQTVQALEKEMGYPVDATEVPATAESQETEQNSAKITVEFDDIGSINDQIWKNPAALVELRNDQFYYYQRIPALALRAELEGISNELSPIIDACQQDPNGCYVDYWPSTSYNKISP